MNAVISAACALLLAFSLDAQIAASVTHLPDGSSEIRIENNAAVELVALAVVANVRGGGHAPFVYYDDSAFPLPAAQDPLTRLPNREAVLKLALLCGTDRFVTAISRALEKRNGHLCEFEQPAAAAIFADGSTTGDASLIIRMMVRRGSVLQALDTTLDVLSDAGRRNIQREQLIDQFKKMADALNRWYVMPEQRVGGNVYQSIAGKLMNLPEQQVGSPFPPGSFVERETQTLRQQRAALLESQPILADGAFLIR